MFADENYVEPQKVFFEFYPGEFVNYDMTLSLQMLFDDVIAFVSTIDV